MTGDDLAYLSELFDVIESRRDTPPADSYVAGLLGDGPLSPTDKVDEEAAELIEACEAGDREAIVHESADLLFHTLVALAAHDVHFDEVVAELKRRRRHGQ